MGFQDVSVGGLVSREFDERVPFGAALTASDCYLDRDGIQGRNGYRAATGGTVGSGGVQALARFRPSATLAKTVAVAGGAVQTVTDPSSETASDGSVTVVSTPFGSGNKISLAQLGKYLYLGTDSATVAMQRMDGSFTLVDLKAIPQAGKMDVGGFSAIPFTLFKNLTATPSSGSSIRDGSTSPAVGGLATDWKAIMDAAGTGDPASGESVYWKLGTRFDATAYDWLVVVLTPYDNGSSTGAVTIQVAKAANDPTEPPSGPATFEDLGMIHDYGPVGGSPNVVFLPLSGLSSGTRSSIRYIRCYLSGANGGRFGVYGFAFLPAKPLANPQKYFATCLNGSGQQESPPTEGLDVTIRDVDKLDQSSPTPGLKYPDCFLDHHGFKTSGSNADVMNPNNPRVFRLGVTPPRLSEMGAVVNVTVHLHSQWTAGQIVRLWKDTENGRRLVTTQTLSSGDITATQITLTDMGGLGTLSNIKYKPGGTPPPCNALVARSGRLIAAGTGNQGNRLFISSYVAPDALSDPYPQFPAVAIEDADGWAFDVAPSNAEQIQALVNGDALYVLTNETCYSMDDLRPNAPPFRVFQRGCVSRRGAIFAEDTLFWASYDGIYQARNRASATEVSVAIRQYYVNTFQPDTSVALAYKDRKLYAFKGTRFIRFDFVTGRWTTGTVGHTVQDTAFWRDPSGTVQQMWLYTSDFKLVRWQDGATSDAGQPIPDWVYSTGYDLQPMKSAIGALYGDVSGGAVDVFAHKNGESEPAIRFGPAVGEAVLNGNKTLSAYKWRLRLTGPNLASVRRLMWERVRVEGKGA